MLNLDHCVRKLDSFSDEKDDVAIAILKTSPQSFHTGIVYKDGNESILLHLALHFDLRHNNLNEVSEDEWYWIKSDIPYIKQTVLSTICEDIWRMNSKEIPYGFLFEQTKINKDGTYTLGKTEIGFTCATFVLGVYLNNGVELFNIKEWPIDRSGDKAFHDLVVEILVEKEEVEYQHIINIFNEKNFRRYKPSEVAISSAFLNIPNSFEVIEAESLRLNEYI